MTIVVSELGINWSGNFDLLIQMAESAAKCGVKYVKIQKREPEISVPRDQWNIMKEPPWGGPPISYIEYKKRLEISEDNYRLFSQHCESIGLRCFASVWDIPSLRFMQQFDPPFIKIPSAKILERQLLRECAKTGKPLIVSTGMTTEPELGQAVEVLNNYRDNQIYLLHTTSSYPCSDSEISLQLMLNMKLDYGWHRGNLHFGFSNHNKSPYPAIYAAVLGAEMIEVHFTLDRSAPGTDNAASIEPPGLSLIVREVNRIPILMGDGKRRLWESEVGPRAKLRGS